MPTPSPVHTSDLVLVLLPFLATAILVGSVILATLRRWLRRRARAASVRRHLAKERRERWHS